MLLLPWLLLLSLSAASCTLISEQGSGNVVTESREVSDFTEVDLEGSGQVDLEVTGSETLSIEAEDNIIPLLETEVRDGRLHLGARSSVSPTTEIIYTMTATNLDGIAVSGSGQIKVVGVDSTDLRIKISGSGDVEVTGEVSGMLSVSISGSGGYSGEGLLAANGSVDVSGSGNAVVNVTDNLDISLSGSGDIEYIGEPSVDIDESGSGSVIQRG